MISCLKVRTIRVFGTYAHLWQVVYMLVKPISIVHGSVLRNILNALYAYATMSLVRGVCVCVCVFVCVCVVCVML